MRQRYSIITLAILATAIWISLNSGVVKLHNVLKLILGIGPTDEVLIMHEIRGPRILAAILVGATLGIGGVLSQGTLRNPLAEPLLLGTTGGSALFTLLGLLIFNVTIGSPTALIFGVIGALIATLLTFEASRRGKDTFAFIVMGIAVSATLTALVGIVSIMINKPEARGVTFWSLGTLSMATKEQVLTLLPILILSWIAAIMIAPHLDYLALGDIRAKHLGKNVSRIRIMAFLIISISVGAITSIFGQIAFLALAIPHISRAMVGVRHRSLAINSALLGATLLLLADLAARTWVSPNELPIGLMSALIGAPILISVVRKKLAKNA